MTDYINDKLKQFTFLVKETFSPETQVILFGSYAKGNSHDWSDIDVAIVTPHVKNRLQQEINLRIKSLDIDERINPFIFSSQEMQDNSPLIWEIKKYGKRLA